ncbi:MAG: glycosyltransferase family 10 [Candidatus Altiarchaeia archaeon]
MFQATSTGIGDDLNYPLVYLQKAANDAGIKVSTIDTEPLESYDAIFFLDFPKKENRYYRELVKMGLENMYLVMFESEIIRPDNFDPKNHKHFKKIFTWKDTLVDNKKYFKIFLPNDIPDVFPPGPKKDKLCVMIAGNKYVSRSLQLYGERVKAIRWFEKNHPEDFDLYGIGWDRYRFKGPKPIRVLNRIKGLTRLLNPHYTSYAGQIERKRPVLQRYKFSICYENARDIPGYITEKIFDCFFAGCVPVYWGAPNITDYIPEETFIDKRKYSSYEELYAYLKNMPDKEYEGYQKAIRNYVKSDMIRLFSAENFAEIIIEEIKDSKQDGRI